MKHKLNALISSVAQATSSAADSLTKQAYAVTDTVYLAFHPTPRMVALRMEFDAKRRHQAEEREMQRLMQQAETRELRERQKQERVAMVVKHKETMAQHQKCSDNLHADFQSKMQEAKAMAKVDLEQARALGQTAKAQGPAVALSEPTGSDPAAVPAWYLSRR